MLANNNRFTAVTNTLGYITAVQHSVI